VYPVLGCLGQQEKATLTLENGFAHLALFGREDHTTYPDEDCFFEGEADLKDAVEKISLGFQRAETKK
jgi:hypothetical protein